MLTKFLELPDHGGFCRVHPLFSSEDDRNRVVWAACQAQSQEVLTLSCLFVQVAAEISST